MPPANPFVRAAAEAEAARFALAAADDFARFFAGDLAELQLRWGMDASIGVVDVDSVEMEAIFDEWTEPGR